MTIDYIAHLLVINALWEFKKQTAGETQTLLTIVFTRIHCSYLIIQEIDH